MSFQVKALLLVASIKCTLKKKKNFSTNKRVAIKVYAMVEKYSMQFDNIMFEVNLKPTKANLNNSRSSFFSAKLNRAASYTVTLYRVILKLRLFFNHINWILK